ncbi:hypothetical protein J4G02_17200 [Candidatus Poribacteria bacterium]|nr:hypothetical protein [Candidatus Poribacteria bacterium]
MNESVISCGQIGLGLSGCEPMDDGVGLHIMWRNGEDSGHRMPLKYREVYDTIAA